MAITYFDLKCTTCGTITENVEGVIGQVPVRYCPTDGTILNTYFGKVRAPYVGYGERPHHDDIERFRFQNLSS